MKWSLLELRKYQETPLNFSETLDLKSELMKRDNLIMDVAPVQVEGLVTVTKRDYLVHYNIQTTITVPSTRSLEPVALPMNFEVDEVFMTEEQYQSRDELIPEEEILLLETAQLDLQQSIEDNLLLTIPMRVLTDEEMQSDELPKGESWEVISEEEYAQRKEAVSNEIDPRLAKLSELFKAEDNE
ncbi:nucleic acid-binding protein [Enterococcus sp. AZ194]|uniref:YceD family protein n=1 Tax=Enterococcus sp. AZ194 TaxID=2774629 RepID=UPI003F2261E5